MIPILLRAAALAAASALVGELLWPPKGDPSEQRALAAADRVGALMGWDHFDEFIERTGWVESRWNPRAGEYRGNAARGLFGLRPETAQARGFPALPLWGPPELQVAAAAAIARNLITHQGARSWIDVRAGWAYPHLADEPATHPRRAESDAKWRGRYAEGVGQRPAMDAEILTRPAAWPSDAAIIAAALGRSER